MLSRQRRRIVALIALIGATLGACGGADRPSDAEWSQVWVEVVAMMPSAEELGEPPDRELCGEALGDLRSSSGELFPTPDLAIEPVVREWVRIAEDALFECPPASKVIPDLASAYAELARLEAEVDGALTLNDPAG